MYVPPHCTWKCQPLDQLVNKRLKELLRTRWIETQNQYKNIITESEKRKKIIQDLKISLPLISSKVIENSWKMANIFIEEENFMIEELN